MQVATHVAGPPEPLRWMPVGAILLVVASAVVEVMLFPAVLTPPSDAIFYIILFGLTLIAYAAFAVFAVRATSLEANVALGNALRWGAVVGALWWVEILEGNVWRWPGIALALLYFGASIAALTVPGLAAFQTARQTGRFRPAWIAGLGAGMVGGLLTFLGGTAVVWIFNAAFLHDPQNMQEFLRSHAQGVAPDLQTYIVGDMLAGMLAHLALIGVVLGAAAGAIGALVGQARPRAAHDQSAGKA